MNVLADAKKEYTQQLVGVLTPEIYIGVKSIYDAAFNHCTKVKDKNILKKFQILLSSVPQWNQSKVNDEYSRIVKKSDCDFIEDLITAVFVSHTKVLSSIQIKKNNKSIPVNVPVGSFFIHKCYIQCARNFWRKAWLLDNTISTIDIQRNMIDSEKLIEESIKETIRKLLPVRYILKEYIDQDYKDDDINDDIEANLSKSTKENLRKLVRTELQTLSRSSIDDNYSMLEIPNDMIDNSRIPINSETKVNSNLQETINNKVDDDIKNAQIIENNKSTNTDFETDSDANTKNSLSKLNMDSEEESINLEDNQEKAIKEVTAQIDKSDRENFNKLTEDTVNTPSESTHKIENDKQVLEESIDQKDEEKVPLSKGGKPILNNVENNNQSDNLASQSFSEVKSIENEPSKDSFAISENNPVETTNLEIQEKNDVEPKELKVINIGKVVNSQKTLVDNLEKIIDAEDEEKTYSIKKNIDKSEKELDTIEITDNNKTLESNVDNVKEELNNVVKEELNNVAKEEEHNVAKEEAHNVTKGEIEDLKNKVVVEDIEEISSADNESNSDKKQVSYQEPPINKVMDKINDYTSLDSAAQELKELVNKEDIDKLEILSNNNTLQELKKDIKEDIKNNQSQTDKIDDEEAFSFFDDAAQFM